MQALPDKRPDTEFVMLNGAHAVAHACSGIICSTSEIVNNSSRSRLEQLRMMMYATALHFRRWRMEEASKHDTKAVNALVLAVCALIPHCAAWVQASGTARMMTTLWQLMIS